MIRQRHRFPDPDAAAAALATAIAADLQHALRSQSRALLLVSGGRSPIPLLDTLARQPLSWERIDVSLVDERSVPADSEAANAGLVRRHLLVDAAAAARWIALMPAALFDATADPMTAARAAARQASTEPALASAAVVVLGMGTDGHTASLFADAPQWEAARTTAERYVALQPQHAPHARVSLSLQALRAQLHCYLWAVGSGKPATLARLQEQVERAHAERWPEERLAQAGPVACLMADPVLSLEVYCCDGD